MADITSQQAVSFSQTRLRPLANRLAQTYYACKALQQEWFAGVSSEFPNEAGAVLIDGAVSSGGKILTGAIVNNVATRAIEFVTDMEANNNAKLNTVLASADQILPQ